MAEVSQKYKYVKLDDGVSFSLARTNPKLTTNTKLMYNGKKMYMESYASSELLNRLEYKNVSVKQNSTFNKDIASFLTGTGSQAYGVYQKFSDVTISDSYDNQFETFYWCGAEYIDSYFYDEEIGFVAPLYLREKLPNYFVIFRLDTPSNYNFNVDENGKVLDSTFDFKSDILDKAVLIKSFDLREGSVLGNYIHNYVEQDGFEFDKSMYVNFSNAEVTYFGINKNNGVLEKRVESFENELLRNDNPVLKDDKWFTEGFERNGLIFPYIMNIEFLFDDDKFKQNGVETYDFARYIGVYCNNIEFGEFSDLNELKNAGYTEDNAIYYFEDNKDILHRYSNNESGLKIDGKDDSSFDKSLISGFEKDRITGYAEPLDIYEGFINRAQYGFEILKPLEVGDWVGIEYNGHVECYFADDKNVVNATTGIDESMGIGEYSGFRFSVNENSTVNDIAEALVKSVNHNKKSKFEAKCSDNVVVFYAKREGKEYNGSETGGAKMLLEASLIYNKKISLPVSNHLKLVSGDEFPVENISDSDTVLPVEGVISSFGDYYRDYFCGACDLDIDPKTETYRNIFKIYSDEYIFFNVGRYLKTKNGNGREICANMIYINLDGKLDPDYRLVIVDDAPSDEKNNRGYDVSVSSTYQVEIMDIFKPNYGVLSWFPVKDFDFDINYSSYGQYIAFADECNTLGESISKTKTENIGFDGNSIASEIKQLAKSLFVDDYGNNLESEYDYYFEQYHPDLCLMSKTTPYISKWGYYDEQKDSCENSYRLNVSKVFGVSNLSANTFLEKCNEDEFTHNMPYYMTLHTPDYLKNYQYIECDELYRSQDNTNKTEQYLLSEYIDEINSFSFSDCVDYWVKKFKDTDVDWFTHFFSGKKYGKRFDRKYSRLLGGDKYHNPSTLFRGVKFEVIRQYNGVDKKTSEYNDYKFSFVYIPVMIDSMVFDSKVHFVKNDTFKFIVGMVFVNTMLGKFNHDIFNGNTNYFNKGFLYAGCKDIIHPSNLGVYQCKLSILCDGDNEFKLTTDNGFWIDRLEKTKKFYMWLANNGNDDRTVIVTNTQDVKKVDDIEGLFELIKDKEQNPIGIEGIGDFKSQFRGDVTKAEIVDGSLKLSSNEYHQNYDTTIYRCHTYDFYGTVTCEMIGREISIDKNRLIDICDIEWEYYYEEGFGYVVDVSELNFKSESLKNILINLGKEDSVVSLYFYNIDEHDQNPIDEKFDSDIKVDIKYGSITIETNKSTILDRSGNNGETIENLMVDIVLKDTINEETYESLALKDYFSVFNQVSMNSIEDSINNDYNVKYYSTIEDNKYKIRVVEPDCIEVKDIYEAVPVKITQNNKSVVGSIEIKEKQDINKIGIKTINRYSGFYNPIFNDILYYEDYIYTNTIGRLGEKTFELPYSNTYIDYKYSDEYGEFGVIKNLYFHKTNITRSDKILTSESPVYPAINEYALDYRDYNIFGSSWDDGYFVSQDNLDTRSICGGIGGMKDSLCMFGSKYLNLPDYIFVDTFENGKFWDEKISIDGRDNTDMEIIYKEINDRTVKYHLYIEKRLKRYLVEHLTGVFSKYINKNYSFGDKSTIKDDVEEYVEKNLLKLYKVDRVYLYIKDERMRTNNRKIENEYLKYMSDSNELKIKLGFPVIPVGDGVMLKDSKFIMLKTNEFDRDITYNLKPGFKESFGFGVSIKRK